MSNEYVTQGTVGWEGTGPEKGYDECRPQDPGGESSHQDPGGVHPPHFHQTKPKGCLTSFSSLSSPSSFISIKSNNTSPLSFRTSQILHFLSLHELFSFHKSGAIYLSFRSPLKYFSKTLVKIHWLFGSAELTLISQKRWRQSKTLRLLLLTSFYANVQNASRREMRPNSRYLCVFV
jgi:hypothetical protein